MGACGDMATESELSTSNYQLATVLLQNMLWRFIATTLLQLLPPVVPELASTSLDTSARRHPDET